MPEYLFTARNEAGKKVTEYVEADSADEAMRQIKSDGFTDIVLHTDDIGAMYDHSSDVKETFTPRELLRFRTLPGWLVTFLPVCLKLYQTNWPLKLLALAVLGWRQLSGDYAWSYIDTLLVVYLAFPIVWAFGAQLMPSAGRRYNALIDATAWGRWEEALALADQVGPGAPPEEIAFRKAGALAGLGRFDEAMETVRPFEEEMPDWMYHGRLADVYWIAGRYDEAAACQERALELEPDNATILLDVAKTQAWRLRNPRRARELMARARQHAMSDLVLPFATMIDGLILMEEGRAAEADGLLREACDGLSKFQHGSPLVGYFLDQILAARCVTAAAQGDLDQAKRFFERARPRLEALKLDWIRERCETAMAKAGG